MAAPYFKTGDSLKAYLRSAFPASTIDSPDGVAPPVAATDTAVVAADGTVTFTLLAAGTAYWVGTGSSPYDYISVQTAPTPSGGSGVTALAQAVSPTFYDDPYTRAAGALGNARSGQAWSAIGSNPPAYIKAGGDWVARLTYGAVPVGAAEFFATTATDLGGPILAGGGRFKIRANAPSTFAGNLIVGCWNGTTNVVPVHIVLTQYFYTLGYVDAGVQTVVDPTQRGAGPIPYVNTPLKADGATVYDVWWALDQAAGVLYCGLPDGTIVSATDPHFAAAFAAPAERPVFEGQVSAATDALFEWLDVWCSTTVPANIAVRIGAAP